MCKISAIEQNTELKIDGRRLGEKVGNESKKEDGVGEGRQEGRGGRRGGEGRACMALFYSELLPENLLGRLTSVLVLWSVQKEQVKYYINYGVKETKLDYLCKTEARENFLP